MTAVELAEKLRLDSAVIDAVAENDRNTDYQKIGASMEKLLNRPEWEQGVRELTDYCGDDPDGMKILTVYLHCLTGTYEKYREKGSPDVIFYDTMGFIPRFLNSHYAAWGSYAFTWAWWMPRQISMNEFRTGEYEYEFFEENGVKKMWLHIPSDAKLAQGDISAVYPFLEKFYPEYKNAPIVCDSWLLSPALRELLPEASNIIAFQNQFNIIRTDWDSPWFMNWIWPRNDMPLKELPEDTTLRKNAKKHLLSGGRIGSGYGEYNPLSFYSAHRADALF